MNRSGFVKLSVLAFGLVLLSFLILGFSRLVIPYRTARVLAAPTTLLAFALVCYLLVRAVLSKLHIVEIEE
ncbi:hypothetical protein [Halococcus sediminicola]|uniref:hypothetical protein n=1 Tax=Halococcus sediminicola TaxID=1264579 RepID=UPI00067990AF|nr:hypothetical protein [Halococcus sediminicola]